MTPSAASRSPAALTDLDGPALVERVVAAGGRPFQARQLEHWVYRHGAADWDGCRNVPGRLRAALGTTLPVRSSRVIATTDAPDGTRKLLLRLHDGESVETVIIPDGERTTLCVSSQVGCPVGCVFCASGLDGVRRNLSAGEIVEQLLHARAALAPAHGAGATGRAAARRLTNVVVMGLGEPMLNLPALGGALDRLCDPDGIALGARRITVSTSGLPQRMRRFAELPHAVGLAVSLHAADDALRRRLVPTASARVAEIVAAARDVYARNHREVTFEVVLLAGVNDRPRDADALVATLRDFPACTVNLIPWNPVDRIPELARPGPETVDAFAAALRAGGLNVTVRRQRGADRDAACGQLRLRDLSGA